MAVLEAHLAGKGPYVMGPSFTIGDIPVGLVVNRWFSVNFKKPEFKAVSARVASLTRAMFRAYGSCSTSEPREEAAALGLLARPGDPGAPGA